VGQLQDHYREMRVGSYLVLMIILLACTRGQVEMSESRESRSFGLDIDWNEIYVSNFEPTSYFSNVLQNLVPVLISAVAGLLFGPFYQSPAASSRVKRESSDSSSPFIPVERIPWILRSLADMAENYHRLGDEL